MVQNKKISRKPPPPKLKNDVLIPKSNNEPTFISSITNGFLFGIGQKYANHMVNSIMPSNSVTTKTNDEKNVKCNDLKKMFDNCHNKNIFDCGDIDNLYIECMSNSKNTYPVL